nr:putative reverse transcriptase domain-containing protein [Tanacetum cinerariifolium]
IIMANVPPNDPNVDAPAIVPAPVNPDHAPALPKRTRRKKKKIQRRIRKKIQPEDDDDDMEMDDEVEFKEQDRHFLGLGCDNIEMDRTVRNVMSDLSGLKKLVKGLSDQFDEYERSKVFDAKRVLEKELVNERNAKEFYREFVREPPAEPSARPVLALYPDDPYVVTRDAAIADAAIATSDIDDDDDTAPMDSQPHEQRGSPRDTQTMPPRKSTRGNPHPTLTQDTMNRMIQESVEAAIRAERERVQNEANRAKGPNVAPVARECTFTDFMKCSPITFRRNEGAVGLIRWIEKTKMVFIMSKCTEANKVVFAAATFQYRALTWWNSQVATLGIEVVTRKTWSEMKAIAEREADNKKRKWENFQGGSSSSGGNNNSNRNNNNYNSNRNYNNNRNNNQNQYRNPNQNHQNNQRQGNARAMTNVGNQNTNEAGAYALRDGDQNLGPNVVTGTFLLNNCYARVLFDSGFDKSFMNINFSRLIDIEPVKVNYSYEVELADGRVVSTNTILRGCALNLVNHVFEIDLMPIELGTFDVIIVMDWLILHDAIIVCGNKEVHMPLKKRTLVVKGDDCVSRLKVVSCVKFKKYVDRGSCLFVAQVIEKELTERRLEDMPVICKFPDVFPEDLPRLSPPREVEFEIELVPRAAPVARTPYRLAPSEMKELAKQLQELSDKGFIRPSSLPWGAPVLFVKKKDGSFRMCIDYREL